MRMYICISCALGLVPMLCGCPSSQDPESTPPTAAFTAAPVKGVRPLLVRFTDWSVPGSAPIESCKWSFGDGESSSSRNPFHTYSSAGDYSVSLTVTTKDGSDAVTQHNCIEVFQDAEITIELPVDVPLTMRWVPTGEFMMGRYDGEQDGCTWEDPQHEVVFSTGFWIGKYEVTQAQWVALMGPISDYEGANRPVEGVSWEDVHLFLSRLNNLHGPGFRLPSEAEWEYACRAGTTTRFYWGDDPECTEIGNHAWYHDNSGEQTHNVGGKGPNDWNLYDMIGNVMEWTADAYHSRYTGAPSDGSVWNAVTENSIEHARVIRGGCYLDAGRWCRSAARTFNYDDFGDYRWIGFRVAY